MENMGKNTYIITGPMFNPTTYDVNLKILFIAGIRDFKYSVFFCRIHFWDNHGTSFFIDFLSDFPDGKLDSKSDFPSGIWNLFLVNWENLWKIYGKSMEFDGTRWNTLENLWKTYGKIDGTSQRFQLSDHPPPLPVQLWLGMLLCGCAMGEMSSPLKRNLDIWHMFRHMFQSFLFFFSFSFFNDTIVCISDTQILDTLW